MEVYSFSSIIEITNESLVYNDCNGVKRIIDFNECRSNWVKHVNNSGDFMTVDGQPYKNITERDTRCVGQRDWYSSKPYIEFFTEPRVRFEIVAYKRIWDVFFKNWKDRYYQNFLNTHLKIGECGWSTFDLG